MQEEVDQNRYTICPVSDPEHQLKLEKYLQERGKLQNKSSYCRFFLRGICIMKHQYCKFAHSFKELKLPQNQFMNFVYPPQQNIKQTKQERKRQFIDKKQFNQTALFIMKNVPYYVLYQYQFSERYQKAERPILSLQQISKDQKVRHRIREILHRQQWDGLMDYLQDRFPNVDFPISFLSLKYAWVGFDKPQTRCKFGDFIKYLMNVRKYVQIQVLMPPSLIKPLVYFVNSKRKQTLLEENIDKLKEIMEIKRQEELREKMEEIQSKQLPQEFWKKFICRYYMAGNCPNEQKECQYAHSIQQLRFDLTQKFLPEYRQPVLPLEKRLNFKSLYDYAKVIPEFKEYSENDISYLSQTRAMIRNHSHMKLYKQFLEMLEEKLGKNKFEMKEIQEYYQNAGFNHTKQNKFQQMEHCLWPLRYCSEDITIKQNCQKRKTTIVSKIPPDEQIDKKFYLAIKLSIEEEISKMSEGNQILQSLIRRNIYHHRQKQMIPLHSYLRLKDKTFQQILQHNFPQYIDKIFFQTSQENLKQIAQIVKKYMKKNKQYIKKIEFIEEHIKHQNKQLLNVNHLMNFKSVVQSILIDLDKKVYFWPFDNNSFVVDKLLQTQYEKTVEKYHPNQNLLDCPQIVIEQFAYQRVILVDNYQNYIKAEKILLNCKIYGVDLEGRLNVQGYIDLIQVSSMWEIQGKRFKQIYVFDIFKMKNNAENQKQYELSVKLLKQIFEDETKVKILHDCRQDSQALKHILGIDLMNVFDTSGIDIYLNQKKLYKEKGIKGVHMIKKIHDVKVPGLNTILDTWKAPNGINIFKQSMKKRFGHNSRQYFQQRPIDPQFLEYSVRDVEDLIDVYFEMKPNDDEKLRYFIGTLYSR